MLKVIKNKFFEEVVFFIALLMATITGFFAKFSFEAIDFNVLGILTTLMLITLAFEKYGLLESIAMWVLEKVNSERKTAAMMTVLTAGLAMFITNDVALITVVPITIIMSKKVGFDPYKIIVLEAVAANIGSSLTPFGNPQNLFIYNFYRMDVATFVLTIAPFVFFGLGLLIFPIMRIQSNPFEKVHLRASIKPNKLLWAYGGLFVLTILIIVLRLNIVYMLVAVSALVLIKDRELFKALDYFLLGTFVCFFIFVDHMNQFTWIKDLVNQILQTDVEIFLTSSILSQGISNVPATILLSAFISSPNALLVGVSVGGLGTMIASLANLIAFKYYAKQYRTRRYHRYFLIINFGMFLFFVGIFTWFY